MAVRTPIEQTEGIYFIIFTCQNWLPLFEITKSYDAVYKWFDYLRRKQHEVKGYVIMPNHLHVIIDFAISEKNINTIVSNGKRSIAYDIIKRLEVQKNEQMLLQLSKSVSASDRQRGKKHQVFERSFDCRQITSKHFLQQKLTYIHNNPCSGTWKLAESAVDYLHSSAEYYDNGKQGLYFINA